MAIRTIAETTDTGFVKTADPDSQPKKSVIYIPHWA